MKKFSYKEYFRDVILDFLSNDNIKSVIYENINDIINWWFNTDEKKYNKEELINSIKSDKTKIVELLDFIVEIIAMSNYSDKYIIEVDDESDYQFIVSYNNILVGLRFNSEDLSYSYQRVKKVPYTCYKYVKA